MGKRSPKAIKAALTRLPVGSTAYDQAYNEAMERIEGQILDSETLAKQVLSWIVYAKRPLTTLQLQHALAVEVDETTLDPDNIPDLGDIVSVCAGLVIIDEESDIIRLVHYTTQEYFSRFAKRWFPTAELDIGRVCLAYQLLDYFASGRCQTSMDFNERLRLCPLYDYVAKHWGDHVRTAVELQDMILDFLNDKSKTAASVQAAEVGIEYGIRWLIPKVVTGVHVTAWFGLQEIVRAQIAKGYALDCQDSNGRTALSYATQRGHEDIVRLLLERENVEADARDDEGRTPLSWTADSGSEAIARMLVERADVEADSKDVDGATPFMHASRTGSESMVKLLLGRNDVNVEMKDNEGRTALTWAVTEGREAVVKLLMQQGDVEAFRKDNRGQSLLRLAVDCGREELVRLLANRSEVDADLRDEDGQTLLCRAAMLRVSFLPDPILRAPSCSPFPA